MPHNKMHKKLVSQAQAHYFGAVAGGSVASDMSKSEAKDKLRGEKIKSLPEKAKKKKK